MTTRLDHFLQKTYQVSRSKISWWIDQGHVLINQEIATKGGHFLKSSDEVKVLIEDQYVGFGGHKLEKAIEVLNLSVEGYSVLDIGTSTGGFLDCLLQKNIKKAIGIDVGSDQCHPKVATNPKVTLWEKTDIRSLKALPFNVELVTIDLSFISILIVIDQILSLLLRSTYLLYLFKPQFEVEKKHLNQKGIVNDLKQIEITLNYIVAHLQQKELKILNIIPALRKNKFANQEYFIFCYLNKK